MVVWASTIRIYPPMAKVLVSFDDGLLRRIDRAAERRGLSRSALLAELASRGLDYMPGMGRSAGAQAAFAHLEELFGRNPVPEDPVAAIRAERDAR